MAHFQCIFSVFSFDPSRDKDGTEQEERSRTLRAQAWAEGGQKKIVCLFGVFEYNMQSTAFHHSGRFDVAKIIRVECKT